MAGVDVEYFMMDDHQETNNLIAELLSSKRRPDENTVHEIDSTLRRHIFIEETVLFPELPPVTRNDVEYLEKEHGEVFRILDSITNQKDEEKIRKSLKDLLTMLLEHNSYEESFIYNFFSNKDSASLQTLKEAPENWKCRFAKHG
ncbi:MAG: hemerythrin domain-containing protein [Thermoplasmataceae archaeon]